MKGNQFYVDGRLYRVSYAYDGPPWPLQVWNDTASVWEDVGPRLVAAKASSPLVRLPNRHNFVAQGTVDYGQPPEFVLTARGDVIGVPGR
jgi:hypothetical protein